MKTKITAIILAVVLLGAMLPGYAVAGKTVPPKVTVTAVRTATTVQITDAFSSVPKGTHTENTRIYAPDGTLYQTYTQQFVPVSGTYTVMHEMGITGTWAQSLPGTWTVRVYLDGVLRGTTTFPV